MNAITQFLLNNALAIFTVLWLLTAAKSILFWLHFIQMKQYRIDRIWQAVKETSFARLFFSSSRSILIGLFIAWEIFLRADIPTPFAVFDLLFATIGLYFLAQVIRTVMQYRKQNLQLPEFTPKIWALFISILFFESLVGYAYGFWPEQLMAIEILQPIIVLLIFSIVFLPNLILFRRQLKKAGEKRDAQKNLIVIGITGSYGKTTMKEYLSHLLSFQDNVLKTPKHINVDTGIAQVILRDLEENHRFFVVEMGAYKKGEIKRICNLVKPEYAVMTGLSNQHLSLFGTFEALKQTKFELVNSVSNDKNIYANADSHELMNALEEQERTAETFGLIESADIKPENVSFVSGKTTFTLDGQEYEADIFGSGHLTNLVGAIGIAQRFNIPRGKIQAALKTLPVIEQTMQIVDGINGGIFIDDTYNANTYGVLTSLKDLSELRQYKKIVVFDQVIELGEDTKSDHKRIAEKIARTADYALILSSPLREMMVDTLNERGMNQEKIIAPSNLKQLSGLIDEKTVVLFEGRASQKTIQTLRQYNV